MSESFSDYTKEARDEFTKYISGLPYDNTLRTKVDDILIAYDQMKVKCDGLEIKNPKLSEVYNIDDKKPDVGEQIYYAGNQGYYEGRYRGFSDKIGWVFTDGGIDCFDEWKRIVP